MAKSNFTDEQIDDYIMGRFDEKNKSKFELAMSSDAGLMARLKERKEFILGIEAYHETAFKDKLKNIHKTAFGETTIANKPGTAPAKQRSLMPWIAAVASIAALLIFVFMCFNDSAMTPEKLYAANFEHYELSLIQRDETNTELLRLDDLYSQRNYKEALPIFESMIKATENASQLQLGLGISKMELGQTTEALLHFKSILDSGDLLYKDQANWYSALAHIKNNDLEKAQVFLQQLTADQNADHYDEAEQLLRQLK